MARRGTSIPFDLRERIKYLRGLGDSYRKIGAALGISHVTVKKYATKFDQNARTVA